MDKLLNFKTLETKDVLELFEIHKQTIKKINRLSRKIKETISCDKSYVEHELIFAKFNMAIINEVIYQKVKKTNFDFHNFNLN